MPSTGRFAQGGKLDYGEAKGSGFAISRMAPAFDGIASRTFSAAEKFEATDPAVAR
jgi:hypothetical protein